MLLAGLDIGTTSLCCALIDGDSGRVAGIMTAENRFALPSAHPWERTQDPEAILACARDMLARLGRDGRPDAIGVTGQMHGILYVDRRGDAAGPLYTWQDGRGGLPFGDGSDYAAALSERAGRRLAAGYGAVTHFYNLRNGLVPGSAVTFCAIQDYVAMKLSDGAAPLVHASDAASFGLYDIGRDAFDASAIRAGGMDPSFFPRAGAWAGIAGETPEGIPVAAAIGDNQAAFLGSVRDARSGVLVNVGTGGQVSRATGSPEPVDGLEIRPLAGGSFLLAGSSLCGGRAYALLESFFRSVLSMAGLPERELYGPMNALAGDLPPPGDRLDFSTLFCGSRENPRLRARISNLGESNFTARHFVAGALDGIAGELHGMYRLMPAPEEAVFVGAGNGVRRNPALRAALARAFGMPLRVPVHAEEAAFGAALFAAAAAGLFRDIGEARRLIRYEDEEASP